MIYDAIMRGGKERDSEMLKFPIWAAGQLMYHGDSNENRGHTRFSGKVMTSF